MRWFGTLAVAVVVALGLVGAVPAPACACSCIPASLGEHFERADVVFAGRLVSRDDRADEATLVYEVSTVYKGNVSARQEIVTHSSSASCGLELTGRGPHLVFGNEDDSEYEPTPREGQYVSGLCGGSRHFDAAARAELEPLGKATKPAAGSTGTETAAVGGTSVGWWIGATGGGVAVAAIAVAGVLVWRRRSAGRAES